MKENKDEKPIDLRLVDKEISEDTSPESKPDTSSNPKSMKESAPDSDEDWIFRLLLAVL